jgi:hypothetical protein
VWGVFNADGDLLGLGEIRTEAILASDFDCDDDDTLDALYEGSNGPHNGVTVERLPLLTPHDAAVLEAAEAYERMHGKWHDYLKLKNGRGDKTSSRIVETVRARRAANAGGEG